tara:strand:+ start:87 stop:872 length:786 start_codon:yes stop_codon:yes gene_type:complete
MNLEGKIAIVTGASRGIGKAMAMGLAAEGAMVVVAARSEESRPMLPGTIHSTVGEIEDAGGKALAVATNVREEDSIRHLVDRTLDEYGGVDILINNAAIGSYTPFLEMSVKEWDLVMSIDLRAPFIACKAVVPIMVEQGGGSIINISSHAANNIFSSTLSADSEEIALIGQNYGAAKVGLERLSWGLAMELGPHNIAVNVLRPLRPVITEGFLAQRPDADVSTWATPNDMVKAAKYLADQDSKGLTGASVTAEELVRRLNL